jgi:CBS domain-containing protein
MKVAELMTGGVKVCAPQDSLNQAAKIMWENDCGCVPVVDRNSRVVGIVTDRDICMAAYTQGVSLHLIPADIAMARHVISCAPEDDVAIAEKLMQENKVHRVPVVTSEGKLVGIVSLSDLAREAERERSAGVQRQVSSEEVAETVGAIRQPRDHATAHLLFGPEEGELEYVPGPPPKRGPQHKK